MNPNPKFGPNDISDRVFATLEDYELVLLEKPDGVAAKEVRMKAAPNLKKSVWSLRTKALVDMGLLVRHGTGPRDKETFYTLPPDLDERKSRLNVVEVHGRKAKDISKPAVEQPPPLVRVKPEALAARGLTQDKDLPKVNGLPHRPSTELQTHVACIIEALESLQVHVNAALPLLLDMERDFERYKKVKEVLLSLKKTSDVVL